MNVAPQVDAFAHRTVGLSQMRNQVARALIVVFVRDAVLGDEHGLAHLTNPLQHAIQPFRIDLPAVLCFLMWTHFRRSKEPPRKHIPPYENAEVVVHANPVQVRPCRMQDTALPQPVIQQHREVVRQIAVSHRVDWIEMKGHADHGLRRATFQYVAGGGMRLDGVASLSQIRAKLSTSVRRPVT